MCIRDSIKIIINIYFPTHTSYYHTVVKQHIIQAQDESAYDYPHTSSCTGDSGFADSNDFLMVPLPTQQNLPQVRGQEDASYAPLNTKAAQAGTGYYKSLQRRDIQIQGIE